MHEKIDRFYSILDCGGDAAYAFSCPPLSDRADHHCAFIADWL